MRSQVKRTPFPQKRKLRTDNQNRAANFANWGLKPWIWPNLSAAGMPGRGGPRLSTHGPPRTRDFVISGEPLKASNTCLIETNANKVSRCGLKRASVPPRRGGPRYATHWLSGAWNKRTLALSAKPLEQLICVDVQQPSSKNHAGVVVFFDLSIVRIHQRRPSCSSSGGAARGGDRT